MLQVFTDYLYWLPRVRCIEHLEKRIEELEALVDTAQIEMQSAVDAVKNMKASRNLSYVAKTIFEWLKFVYVLIRWFSWIAVIAVCAFLAAPILPFFKSYANYNDEKNS